MIRNFFAVLFLLLATQYCVAQPEQVMVICHIDVECSNDPGYVIQTHSKMSSSNCTQCYVDLKQQIDIMNGPGWNPCSYGATPVYRLKKCLPYSPYPTYSAAESTAVPSLYTVKLDYLFDDGTRLGPEAQAPTLREAYCQAMQQMAEFSDSGLFGKVTPGSGRCFVISPQGCTTRCYVPVCPRPCAVSPSCDCQPAAATCECEPVSPCRKKPRFLRLLCR